MVAEATLGSRGLRLFSVAEVVNYFWLQRYNFDFASKGSLFGQIDQGFSSRLFCPFPKGRLRTHGEGARVVLVNHLASHSSNE